MITITAIDDNDHKEDDDEDDDDYLDLIFEIG